LDLEIIGHTQKIINGLTGDDFDGDLLAEVREGLKNGYIMNDRTLDNINNFSRKPGFFNRKTFGAYSMKPFPIEMEKAVDKARELMNMPPLWKISDEMEAEAERIFKKAMNG
jgi:trimethylamine:corrinoid methyltransferase-like protein